MLLSLLLAEEGFVPVPLSRHLEAERERYYEALRLAQQSQDPVPLVLLLSEAIDEGVRLTEAWDRGLSSLPKHWLSTTRWAGQRPPREGSAARRLLDLLPVYPVVTVGTVARHLGVSRQAANLAVRELEDARVLAERNGWRRNRVFASREALAAIVRSGSKDAYGTCLNSR